MPVLSGIEAAKLISKLSPGSRIVFVTQYDDSAFRTAALATGAELYLLKSHVASELVPSVESLSTTLNPVQLK
jgi:DNA-binding NarL/FixJ family response regulator